MRKRRNALVKRVIAKRSGKGHPRHSRREPIDVGTIDNSSSCGAVKQEGRRYEFVPGPDSRPYDHSMEGKSRAPYRIRITRIPSDNGRKKMTWFSTAWLRSPGARSSRGLPRPENWARS